MGIAQIAMRCGEIRLDLEGAAIARQGRVQLAAITQRIAQVVVQLRRGRFDGECLPVGRGRLGETTGFQQRIREPDDGRQVSRPQRECPAIMHPAVVRSPRSLSAVAR